MEKKKKVCLITGGIILGLLIGSGIAFWQFQEEKSCPMKKMKKLICCKD